tara:strand:+ start:626 stop:1129 length:504 start_codon:yes stop_codon:yes gene_type:complete
MQSINKFTKSKFILIFGNIFENSKWIAERTYKFSPFKNFNDIKLKMLTVYKNLSKKEHLKIILKHPDLADKIKIYRLSKDSQKEQKKSSLDQCTKKEFEEFKKLNKIYKKKFGFPFILAILGKNKNQILYNFRKRILSNKHNEFKEAKTQVMKIATLRLKNLKKNFQ